jgi:hypothetical protein
LSNLVLLYLICVGFGPASLAIAIALADTYSKIPSSLTQGPVHRGAKRIFMAFWDAASFGQNANLLPQRTLRHLATQQVPLQWRQLVLGPLSRLDDSDTHPSYVVVIDALDECEGDKYVRTIIQLLAEARSLKKVRLRALITSRPEVPIRATVSARFLTLSTATSSFMTESCKALFAAGLFERL